MVLEFGYGKGSQIVTVPDDNVMGVLRANSLKHEHYGIEAVRYALLNPIGTPRLCELASPGQKIAIITSDISRPMPTRVVLPAVLEELYAAGANPQDITLVFATGSHRTHTDEEKRMLMGEECYSAIKCMDNGTEEYVHFGTTQKSTPVDISRTVAEADFRICLGNIEFHYFAGYSGGAKAIMPGVSTPKAIQVNHRRMNDPGARAGNLAGNPVRADIEEAADMVGVDFIVNVVLDEHKKIVYAVAGDVTKAHRAGCEYLDKMYRTPITALADIVLVSQGGAPKDANLYQLQKALANAEHAVREGGTIILIGACVEGLGNAKFEQWMEEAAAPRDLTDRIAKNFELGGHKAAAMGKVFQRSPVSLVSELDPGFVRSIFMTPYASAQLAFDEAFAKYGVEARILAMPFGGSTLPVLSGN